MYVKTLCRFGVSMMTEYQGTGKRRRIEIAGENYYLFVGDRHVDCTIPHENRPENIEQRVLINTLCKEISKLMQLRNEETESANI